MRAVLLAAGLGRRLENPLPKCLLRFDGVTLLERHLRLLREAGVDEIVIAVGYAHRHIRDELERLAWTPAPVLVENPRYDLGSVLTVATVASALGAGGDVLLMDADVLYDQRALAPLVAGAHANRLIFDRGFEPGDEPVKLCLAAGVPVELRKRVEPALQYDTIGESVGFFRLTEAAARRLAALCAQYVLHGKSDQPHEEAVRDLLLERSHAFEATDVSGAPWMEIDFPIDVERARTTILPRLRPLAPAATRFSEELPNP